MEVCSGGGEVRSTEDALNGAESSGIPLITKHGSAQRQEPSEDSVKSQLSNMPSMLSQKQKKKILVVFKYDHYTAYHSETLVLSVTNADGINRVKIKKKPKYIYMHAGEGAVMVQQPNLEYSNGKGMNKIQHDTLPILKHLCIIVINMLRFWNDFV